MPPFATVLETNGCAMPSVNLQHYSLNRPFEWVPTQNANNVEDSPTGRRMGVNRDFTAWEFWDWLHFPPAVFAKTRRPRSSYGRAYGRRVSAAAAIGKRSCLAHWGPDDTLTGQNSRDTPPLYLVPLGYVRGGAGIIEAALSRQAAQHPRRPAWGSVGSPDPILAPRTWKALSFVAAPRRV